MYLYYDFPDLKYFVFGYLKDNVWIYNGSSLEYSKRIMS